MFPTEPHDCLAMIWPPASPAPERPTVDGAYALRTGPSERDFNEVQATIGFHVTDDHRERVVRSLVGELMVFAEVRGTGEPVAVAAAERRANDFVELGWVAVAPPHRGRGLGRAVCAVLTRRLVEAGEPVFLSTQDHRVEALRIYLALGFHPIFRVDKADRWRAVCERLGAPFAPDAWGWPL